MTANSHGTGVHQQQESEVSHDKKTAKRLSSEDRVVICFSLLGLIGSVALYYLKMPSIMVSIFLSAGITALVYRFLGGIRNVSFAVGALKLGGTIAALIGIAFWIDRTEELNPRFHLVSTDMILGDWEWDYAGPSMGWNGHLEFEKKNGQLTFKGKEYNVVKTPEGKQNVLLYGMTNGKAELIGGTYLSLESDVKDYQYSRNFHWKSVEPLTITPAFLGRLRPTEPSDQNLESEPYGMLIYKKTNSP